MNQDIDVLKYFANAKHQKQISFYPDYTVGSGIEPDLLTPP
jgi:hypothetical protein